MPKNPEEEVVVSRRDRGGLARLDSPPPINRYAGDWSICGRDLLSGQDADYDEVAGSESDGGKQMSLSNGFPFLGPNKDGNCTLRSSVETFFHSSSIEKSSNINMSSKTAASSVQHY